MALIALCHVAGSHNDVVLKAVVETDQLFILCVLCCHAIGHVDARHPDHLCSGNLQHPLVHGCRREQKACILLVYIKEVLSLGKRHAL